MHGMKIMRITVTLWIFAARLLVAFCGIHPDGVSKVSREQDALGNYKFSYSVSNNDGEHFREEGTDNLGRIVGTYGLTHSDGSRRVVDYVADKDGFHAEVRSNEPGMASSEFADATDLKLQPNLPLVVAATSIDSSRGVFGTRLNTDKPKVSHVGQEKENLSEQDRVDNSARESRQRNFDDYRPQSQAAYYPRGAIDTARPLNHPAYASADIPEKTRSRTPSVESKPLDVYLPPINPHSVIRRPPYFDPNDRATDGPMYSTTSRRPFIPPYGGFDDDPLPIPRRPGVSMSTIHGGYGVDDFHPPQTTTPSYGAGRYRPVDIPLSRDFPRPRFPPASNGRFPHVANRPPRLPGTFIPTGPRNLSPGSFFGPPSYVTPRRPPNFVLRAVPIPNGIQAVRVDPETGRVYERLMYPLYLRQDGYPEYDKNILLHNDDVNDDDAIRNDKPEYLDFPFRRRPPFRSIRNTPSSYNNRTRPYNRSFVDPRTLSVPTARDLDWVQRQLSLVEDFDRSRFPNPSFMKNSLSENDNEYPPFNDFDDSSDENPDMEDSAYARSRNLDRSLDMEFSRNPRIYDSLTPEDTKAIIVSERKRAESNPEPAETNSKPAVTVQKE